MLLLLLLAAEAAGLCDRGPGEGVMAPKLRPHGKFSILLNGEPQFYKPGEMYTVTLKSFDTLFVWFSLWAEASGGNIGNLHPFGDTATKRTVDCPGLVTAANSLPKLEASSLWSAPPPGSGCVVFKATVVVSREQWYSEDGPLTYTICENISQSSDEQPAVIQDCCACDEAKYEVGFEGLWSRQTHPKDFPDKNITKFSDVIGASHTTEYRFWEYSGIASEGLREVAELGSTRTLESELKSESQHIRTIIKARGIAFPNVTSKTFAVFRVDRKHHLISLVSMIMPSPDWIVGVSGLELCLVNCSWVESRVLNLFPWDAGTDSGVTYLSPKNRTEPKDHIRRITSSFPADPRSPFFDPTGEEMKPLAKLYLTRQRLYEKTCEKSTETESPGEEEGESTSEAPSNLELGSNYNDGDKELFGNIGSESLRNEEAMSGATGDVVDCQVTSWTGWSHCSVSCGQGWRKKIRRIVKNARNGGKACPRKLLKAKKCSMQPCDGRMMKEQPDSSDEDENQSIPTEECVYQEWGPWSKCEPECGMNSLQERRRVVDRDKTPHYLSCTENLETRLCNVLPCGL